MWQIVGHERAVRNLSAQVASETLPHALLLTGPTGVGKTRLAIELTKALNCIGDDPPCGVCVHCRQIESRTHPDLTVVERVDGKDSISIAQVRALREDASLRPFQGRRKVVLVTDAEYLTAQAADALLKTLEEPPPQLTIILTSVDPHGLPATVVSRCRVFSLAPVQTGVLQGALEARGVAPEEAERLARLAGGNAGWAFEAASQPRLRTQREEMLARLLAVPGMGLPERLDLAEELAGFKDRAAVRRSLESLLLLARDYLLIREGLAPRLAAPSDAVRRQASALDLPVLASYIARIRVAMERLDANVDARLVLEALLLEAPCV